MSQEERSLAPSSDLMLGIDRTSLPESVHFPTSLHFTRQITLTEEDEMYLQTQVLLDPVDNKMSKDRFANIVMLSRQRIIVLGDQVLIQ